MQQAFSLKPASIMFAVVWTLWMGWSTGITGLPEILLLAVCGTLAGVGWYYAMRYWFRFVGLLPSDGQSRAD